MAPGALPPGLGPLSGQHRIHHEVLLPGDGDHRVWLWRQRRNAVQGEGHQPPIVLPVGPPVLGHPSAAHRGHYRPPSHQDGHILPAVHGVGDRRGRDAQPEVPRPELLATVRPIRCEGAVEAPLEDQIASGGHGPRAVHAGKRNFPSKLLPHRIPRPEGGEDVVVPKRRTEASTHPGPSDPGLGSPGGQIDAAVVVDVGGVDGGEVGQPGIPVVRHGVPAVSPQRARRHHLPAIPEAGLRDLHRPPRLHVDVGRPRHLGEGLRRDQRAVGPVQHVEEAVLRGMHEDLPLHAVEDEIGQDDVHVGVVVPRLPGRRLIVPEVVAGVGIQRHDGRQEEIVAAVRAPDLLVPG